MESNGFKVPPTVEPQLRDGELYRYLVDDFVIQFCQGLKMKNFTVKSEAVSNKRKGKREYLNDAKTRRMMKELGYYFESKVDIPFIRHGSRQG